MEVLKYLWKYSAKFKIHNVVHVELAEALVEIVFEHRSISDQTIRCLEGLFKYTPHHSLSGVHCLWILISEERQVAHDAKSKYADMVVIRPTTNLHSIYQTYTKHYTVNIFLRLKLKLCRIIINSLKNSNH